MATTHCVGILAFEGYHLMASPQVENGYLKIATELWDALIRYRLPGEQRQIVDAIIRKTYGYNKKQDAISLSQFVKMTGCKKPNIIRSIKSLLSKKIIVVIKTDNKIAHVYKINKNYQSWVPLSKKITLSKVITNVIKTDNDSLSKVIPTKDNTQKTIIKNNPPTPQRGFIFEKFEYPDWVDRDLFIEFCKNRHADPKGKIRSERAINGLVNKLSQLIDAGNNQTDIITEAITNNWKSFYPPKNHTNGIANLKPQTYAQAQDLERRMQARAVLEYDDARKKANNNRRTDKTQPGPESKAIG
jgi:phage replication O-like protein O